MWRFTQSASKAIKVATELARARRGTAIDSGDLLLGVLSETKCYAVNALRRQGIDLEQLTRAATVEPASDLEETPNITFSEGTREVLNIAYREARALKYGQIGTEHLLLGMIKAPGGKAGTLLTDLGVTHVATLAVIVEMYAMEPGPDDQ